MTEESYQGRNGESLRLRGLEQGINDLARERAIVIHGAPYVSRDFIKAHGRLGRSWGCPALRREVAHSVIDLIRGGSLVLIYYPNESWLRHSHFLGAAAVLSGKDGRRSATPRRSATSARTQHERTRAAVGHAGRSSGYRWPRRG
ncbi:MAG: murein L,D-transpeptidase catalytic domain-containing protein [Chromatiales bacterium]